MITYIVTDSPPSPSPTRRKPTDVRRLEIAQAALRVIGQRGASSLTAATLAKAVGVTSGALYRHFDSMEEILAGAVQWAVEQVDATFPEPTLPARTRLLQMARARVELIRRTPGLAWLLLSDQVYLSVPSDAVETLRALVKRSQRYLLAAVEEGVAEGSLRTDIEPRTLLVLLSGTIHALAGMTGVHADAGKGPAAQDPQRVLEALLGLMAPA
jgi:TetR/AcrR family fatty acid metabolism transcriptional regulator